MYPTKAASNLFQIQNSVAFLNAYDTQRLHFRYPDLQYASTLQESTLIHPLPNGFQYVVGGLAFSSGPNGKISVYDLARQELIATANNAYCELYDVVLSDKIYLFGAQDGMTTILSFENQRFGNVTTMSGLWEDYGRTQTGICYLFSGRIFRNDKSTVVPGLFKLANNELVRVEVQSAGIPCPRNSSACFRINERLFCIMDGVTNGIQLNDIWIFDQKQAMFMQLNRTLLRIQPIRKPYLQWKWKDQIDLISTISGDQAICRFGLPAQFDEIDWIRADRQIILKRCQEKGLV